MDRRRFALAASATVAGLAGAGGLAACRGDAAHILIGMQVPRVTGTTTTGDAVAFDRLGKAALVRFWGLWCGPCVADEPYWEQVATALKRRTDLRVLSVHAGLAPAGGPSLAEWAAAQPPAAAVPVVDDRTRAVTDAFRIPGTPSTVLINAQGRVIEHSWAFRSDRGVRSFVRKIDYIMDRDAAPAR